MVTVADLIRIADISGHCGVLGGGGRSTLATLKRKLMDFAMITYWFFVPLVHLRVHLFCLSRWIAQEF